MSAPPPAAGKGFAGASGPLVKAGQERLAHPNDFAGRRNALVAGGLPGV